MTLALLVKAELLMANSSKGEGISFNLSKTFENNLKMLIDQFSNVYAENNLNFVIFGSPGEMHTIV